MRIACLQFAPKLGDIDNNLNRADAVLSKANPADLDLLVLPELAFTGFNFKSLQQITPFLEPKGSGITSLWSRTVALKYDCVVCAGYPEMVDVSKKWPTGPEYYNSTIVVNGEGETIGNYRKTFLYTDEKWALEGNTGFFSDIIPGLGNTAIGICTDLNPYKFEAPWHAFEFAYHILDNYSNLVILTMAWMTREDGRAYSRTPQEPDLETLTYWITRLEPLIRSENKDEIIVVFCNRSGSEEDATYAGTSAVLGILDGEVRVYGMLGRGEKSLLVVDTNNPPRAKMVYRPEDDVEEAQIEPPTATKKRPSKPDLDAYSSRSYNASPAPSTVRAPTSRHKPPPSPRPPAPPPAPEKQSRSRSNKSSNRRESSSRTRQPDLSIRTAPPENDDGGIPTPSAPSPTPMAMRPRLSIPDSAKSPPSIPLDDFSEPPSAISLRSQASSMSTHSYMSKTSQSTVRSFARAPEDSTPYPHSGHPGTAYPFSPARKIYSGTISFNEEQEIYRDNPDRQFWSPSPQSPEAFLWPPARLGQTRKEHDDSPALTWDSLRQHDNSSAQNRERKAAARKSGGSLLSEGTAKFFSKATPPGSRSASRNRARNSGINTGMMDPAVAFAHHTAHLIPEADNAERIRAMHGTDSPIPDRPSSPKSRNASRNRPTGSPELHRTQSTSIPIFASPSVVGGNTAPNGVDRGRPIEPKDTMNNEQDYIRRPSLQSSHPSGNSASSSHGRLPSRPPSRPPSRQQPSRRQSHSHRRMSSSNIPDFERVEEILHDGCPVHGRGSRAGSVTESHTAPPPSPPPLRPATLPLRSMTPVSGALQY